MKYSLLGLLCIWLLGGCAHTRNLVYFSDLPANTNYKVDIRNEHALRVGPGDLLGIDVQSLNPESNAVLNRGAASGTTRQPAALDNNNFSSQGYLVDAQGNIDYPIIGKIQLGGLTLAEATEKLKAQLQTYIRSPVVDVRLLNFRITVIGEVNKPATFTVASQQINVLEALGLAGDMTQYGKRENVLLIREQDGERSTTRLDLNRKEILSSPYFYLRQNDVIYVQPDRQKEIQASTNTRTITIVTIATSVVVALIFNFRNIF